MKREMDKRIAASRLLLQNPYAYLDDIGGFSANFGGQETISASNEEIVADRLLLQNQYAHISGDGSLSATRNLTNVMSNSSNKLSPEIAKKYASLILNRRKKAGRTNSDIEKIATHLQQQMWRDRDQIWSQAPSNPIELLNPSIALELIGYSYSLVETLGQYRPADKLVEVAGIIDNNENTVRISRKFQSHIRNYTTAHELGHALLHETSGLHRDRPIDGSSFSRDAIEFEADKFASYFLMPKKHVLTRFMVSFGTDKFFLNEESSFALTRATGINLTRDCNCLRDLTRILASAQSYNGVHFMSLANQFHVSIETMAIRLEELELVIY